MPKQKNSHFSTIAWRIALSVILVAVAAYILGNHWQTVSDGFRTARLAQTGWLGLALCLTAVTFAIAAAIYGVLALKPLRYRQTVLVEMASAFANRLLPAGLGGIGLHGVYLYKRRHTAAQATAVVSVNNLVGISAHLSLLGLLLVLNPATFQQLNSKLPVLHWWYGLLLAGLVLVLLLTPRLKRFGKNLLSSLRLLRLRHILFAFCLALSLTATYTLIVWCIAQSLDLPLNALQAFVILTIGMLLGTATPTPGGLVGAEAGFYAGFVGYGANPTVAAAAVLLYRLFTYWLPLLPGCLALLLARQRKLV